MNVPVGPLKVLRLVAGLVLAVAGTLTLGLVPLSGKPDLFLVAVADAARGGAPVLAMTAGLVAGLLEDTLTNPDRLLGLHAFSKVLVGYLVAMLGSRTVVEKPIAVGGLVAGAALLETGIVVGLVWVLRGALLLPAPGPLAVGAVATGLVGAGIQALSLVPWRARREARRRRRLSL